MHSSLKQISFHLAWTRARIVKVMSLFCNTTQIFDKIHDVESLICWKYKAVTFNLEVVSLGAQKWMQLERYWKNEKYETWHQYYHSAFWTIEGDKQLLSKQIQDLISNLLRVSRFWKYHLKYPFILKYQYLFISVKNIE